jgi:ribonuclease VapC
MMVVDTSVLVACIAHESLRDMFLEKLFLNDSVIATPTLVETGLWIARNGTAETMIGYEALLALDRVNIIAFTSDMAQWAIHAINTYGKGSGHKAQLNFGDCLSYGVAKALDAPLLFTGDDFTHTDLIAA